MGASAKMLHHRQGKGHAIQGEYTHISGAILKPMQRLSPPLYPMVDVLRGLSALLVVFYHVIALQGWPNYPGTGVAKLPLLGWIGVDLFFVISGFVIGHSVIRSSLTGLPWRRIFAEHRLRRIVPLYVATSAIYLFLVNPELMRLGWASVWQIALHLGFVHNLWHESHGTINPPTWSLGLEMQFYVLVVLCAPWLARAPVWKIVTVWTAIAVAWRLGVSLALPPGQSELIMQFIYTTQLPGVLDEFVFGIWVARLVHAQALQFSWIRLLCWGAGALLLLTLASQALLGLETIVPATGEISWCATALLVLWRTLLSAGFAALVACMVMIPGNGGSLMQPFRYLGKISYGIYLWHMPILSTLLLKTPWRGSKMLFATVACTLVMAALSWHGFESLWINARRNAVQK